MARDSKPVKPRQVLRDRSAGIERRVCPQSHRVAAQAPVARGRPVLSTPKRVLASAGKRIVTGTPVPSRKKP